jgi:hypothetical protein
MWYRVFGLSSVEIQPAELLEHLRGAGIEVKGHFRGDEEGWFEVQLALDNSSLTLSRFLATEEGVRGELNAWATWIEQQEANPHRDLLMRQLIAVKQVFTWELQDHDTAAAPLAQLAGELCRYLAAKTSGVYQQDGCGFCAADGTILVPE